MGKARRIGVGMDYSTTSKKALAWAADNMVTEEAENHLILLHVQPPNSDDSRKLLFEDTGSRTYI